MGNGGIKIESNGNSSYIGATSSNVKHDDVTEIQNCYILKDYKDADFYVFRNEPNHDRLQAFEKNHLFSNVTLHYNKTRNYISILPNENSEIYYISCGYYNFGCDFDITKEEFADIPARFPTGRFVMVNKSSWFGLVQWKENLYRVTINDAEKVLKEISYELKTFHNIKSLIVMK